MNSFPHTVGPNKGHVCSIIPPHLLRALASSGVDDEDIRSSASATLELTEHLRSLRHAHRHRHHRQQGIVPDHILRSVAGSSDVDEDTRTSASTTLQQSQDIRDRRQGILGDQDASSAGQVTRDIYDAHHTKNSQALPGSIVRKEGQPVTTSSDDDVNSCYDNFGYTFDFYSTVFGRTSVDNKDLPLIGSVHFGTNFANAFWNGQQMVFGDGNKFLYHFTESLDVIAHELTHGVTQYTANLDYENQSGALNESCSDVFGVMAKQYHLGETAEQADWLIGEGCLYPGVKGVALRSMKAPGTAYDDDTIGKDPQSPTMSGYQNLPNDASGDYGGVHTNSGIPNHAFYLAAIGFGGNSWDKAGKIWYNVLTGSDITHDCDFKQFANLTCAAALSLFGDDAQKIVQKAWTDVEVL